MAGAFDEIRFPTDIVFGFAGGPEFFTTVTATTGGNEQRNQNWSLARAKYVAEHRIKEQTELDLLIEFFYARRGKLRGFRFRDWVDYCSDMPTYVPLASGLANQDTLPAAGVLTAQSIGTARADTLATFSVDGPANTLTSGSAIFGDYTVGTAIRMSGWTGVGIPMNNLDFVISAINTANTVLTLLDPSSLLVTIGTGDTVTVETVGFQLRKTYPAVTGTDYIRTITKPVSAATVRMYDDAVEQVNVTPVTTTGFVTFDLTFEPADSSVITADYLFDVPVRFDNDHFSSSLEHFNLSDWNGITLVEVREL